jgi:PII-like signaling protein
VLAERVTAGRAAAERVTAGRAAAGRVTTVSEDYLKLTSYFAERRGTGPAPAADALVDLYARSEIAASVLLRGTQGPGSRPGRRSGQSMTSPADRLLLAVAVDARPRIESVLEQTLAMTAPGLVTLEHTCLVDSDTALSGLRPGSEGEEARLTVYLGRHEQAYQMPAYEAICALLYRRCLDGATALLGVDGTARGRRQRARSLSRRAEVPVMVIAVGPWDQIVAVVPEVCGLVRHPLLTLEPVRVCVRDGLFQGVPDRPPRAGEPGAADAGAAEHGMDRWQKLTVYTSQAARHEGQPLQRTLARRLLSADISGVTTLRGVWGFRGEHAPHGDGALRRGRHVPAVTIVIDAPDRIPAAFTIIGELTAGRGLVTSETIGIAGRGPVGQNGPRR